MSRPQKYSLLTTSFRVTQSESLPLFVSTFNFQCRRKRLPSTQICLFFNFLFSTPELKRALVSTIVLRSTTYAFVWYAKQAHAIGSARGISKQAKTTWRIISSVLRPLSVSSAARAKCFAQLLFDFFLYLRHRRQLDGIGRNTFSSVRRTYSRGQN